MNQSRFQSERGESEANLKATSPGIRRVALVSDWFYPRRGGIESHLLSLALHLKAAGIEPEVITPFPGPGQVEGVRVHRLKGLTVKGPRFSISPLLPQRLKKVLKSGHYDVVHCHYSIISPAAMAGLCLGPALGLPTVITFHSILRHFRWVLRGLKRVLPWGRGSACFTAVSEAVARDLRWLMPHQDVELLPNAVDVAFWKAEAPETVSVPVKLISALRFHSKKRPQALIQIASRLKQRVGPEMKFSWDLVGAGPERELLENEIEKHGLRGWVRICAWEEKEALRRRFHSAHAFVSAAKLEAFGLAGLEARAAGLPVLAIGGNGFDDWLRQGQDGVRVKSDRRVLDVLDQWVRSPGELEAIRGQTGRELENWDWESGISRHVQIYEQAQRFQGINSGSPKESGPGEYVS